MGRHTRDLTILTCIAWTCAFCTLLWGIADSDRVGHNSVVLAVGLALEGLALVPTGWLIVRKVTAEHRASVEELAEIIETLHHHEPAEVHSIR